MYVNKGILVLSVRVVMSDIPGPKEPWLRLEGTLMNSMIFKKIQGFRMKYMNSYSLNEKDISYSSVGLFDFSFDFMHHNIFESCPFCHKF